MGLFNKIKTMAGGTDADLMAHGRLGRGVIVGVELTGTAVTLGVEEYRVCNLAVQVFLDGEQPYVAQARQRVPEWQLAAIAQGGSAVAVRVDPAEPQRVALDLATEPPVVTVAPPVDGGVDRILEVGTSAEAVIVADAPLGVRSAKGHDLHLFTLTVMRAGRSPYQTQLGNPVPPDALPLLFPGSRVPVKIDADDDDAVAIDWEAALTPSTP